MKFPKNKYASISESPLGGLSNELVFRGGWFALREIHGTSANSDGIIFTLKKSIYQKGFLGFGTRLVVKTRTEKINIPKNDQQEFFEWLSAVRMICKSQMATCSSC